MTGPRRAVVGDLEGLLLLVARFYEIDRHEYDEETVLGGLIPLLADDNHGQVWVVDSQSGGDLIAYAVITWSWSLESGGMDAILDEIYVDDRNQGVGAILLEHVMAMAARAGASGIFLETEVHNDRVRRFYSRHGFETEESVWMRATLG